jgi:hypothetical protein
LKDLIWISLDHLGNVLGVIRSVSGGANFDCQNLKLLDVESELEEFNKEQTLRVSFKKWKENEIQGNAEKRRTIEASSPSIGCTLFQLQFYY